MEWIHDSPIAGVPPAVLSYCIFSSNRAEGDGGGAEVLHTSTSFFHCVFSDNVAGYHFGGALELVHPSSVEDAQPSALTNCTFKFNICDDDDDVMY